MEGFLAGATRGQAAEYLLLQGLRAQRQGCEWTGHSAGLTGEGTHRRLGGPRSRGANVYASRWAIRPAFWEVSSTLTRPI